MSKLLDTVAFIIIGVVAVNVAVAMFRPYAPYVLVTVLLYFVARTAYLRSQRW